MKTRSHVAADRGASPDRNSEAAASITRRRCLVAGGVVTALPGVLARAQSSRPRVAFLGGGAPADHATNLAALREGLAAAGYRIGDNLELVAFYATYSADRAQALAVEIAAQKPSVIVASGGGIIPAARLKPPFPVVLVHSGDPVDAGLVDSYARPGRNVTGISLMALDLIPKRLEYTRALVPSMRRVALLASPEHPGQKNELAAFHAAARQFGIAVEYYEARNPDELAQALKRVEASRPDAVLLFSDGLMAGQRQALAAHFLRQRIPSAASWSAFPEAGHLLSYGPERNAAWRRVASYVDRILKGARPGDLPIELPTAFELVVNRRTAAALGLALPPAIVTRADRIVETSPAA